jgi:hypothetical protein
MPVVHGVLDKLQALPARNKESSYERGIAQAI